MAVATAAVEVLVAAAAEGVAADADEAVAEVDAGVVDTIHTHDRNQANQSIIFIETRKGL